MTANAIPIGELRDEDLPDTLSLPEGYLSGVWLVDVAKVNLDDLSRARPGSVLRMLAPDAIKYVPPSWDDYERVAGMVSDAA